MTSATEINDPALQAFIANRDQNLFYGIHDTWEKAESVRVFL